LETTIVQVVLPSSTNVIGAALTVCEAHPLISTTPMPAMTRHPNLLNRYNMGQVLHHPGYERAEYGMIDLGGKGTVPELSRFFGIVIAMHRREHPPPHFHARYGRPNGCNLAIRL
jgi:hypothetical protein